MNADDFQAIRRAIAALPSDHDAGGEHRPQVGEIFAPEQHANALDPNTPIVVGSRGTGKSFWAGVLEREDTRAVAAAAYPHLGLEDVRVRFGYTGFSGENTVDARTIDARVPRGQEQTLGVDFWRAIIIRAARSLAAEDYTQQSISRIMSEFDDPEEASFELRRLDNQLSQRGVSLVVIFDALDTIARDWQRQTLLTDALFEVAWSLRAFRGIKTKIFIRPEQLFDEGLRFIELPKMRSGRVELEWSQIDLYGLLFWRLSETADSQSKAAFEKLIREEGISIIEDPERRRRRWQLLRFSHIQEEVMFRIAGIYMGRGTKKGKTYDWPYKHLADGKGEVTPRSFIRLFNGAASYLSPPMHQAITAEGIRYGLQEASKVRVDQLYIEYKWVKRALAPLAGLLVPCSIDDIFARWRSSKTVNTILLASQDESQGFLPPFRVTQNIDRHQQLAAAMERIAVFSYRSDGRIDIPDLYRVAAKMLKKGAQKLRRAG